MELSMTAGIHIQHKIQLGSNQVKFQQKSRYTRRRGDVQSNLTGDGHRTPADFHLWPTLKKRIYKVTKPFTSVRYLMKQITYDHCKLEQLERGFLVDEVMKRWERCIACNGERL